MQIQRLLKNNHTNSTEAKGSGVKFLSENLVRQLAKHDAISDPNNNYLNPIDRHLYVFIRKILKPNKSMSYCYAISKTWPLFKQTSPKSYAKLVAPQKHIQKQSSNEKLFPIKKFSYQKFKNQINCSFFVDVCKMHSTNHSIFIDQKTESISSFQYNFQLFQFGAEQRATTTLQPPLDRLYSLRIFIIFFCVGIFEDCA